MANKPQNPDEKRPPSDDPERTMAVPPFDRKKLLEQLRRAEKDNTQSQTTDYRDALKEAMHHARQDPKWGKSKFTDAMTLEIQLHGTNARMHFSYGDIGQLVIGREDPHNDFTPQVNLTPYNASNLGISRKHAIIEQHDDVLMLNDLGSRNGTYLNGKLVRPQQPRILRSGDEVRVGYVTLQVFYRQLT